MYIKINNSLQKIHRLANKEMKHIHIHNHTNMYVFMCVCVCWYIFFGAHSYSLILIVSAGELGSLRLWYKLYEKGMN